MLPPRGGCVSINRYRLKSEYTGGPLDLTSQKTLNNFSARLGQNHCICIQTEIRTSRASSPDSLQRLYQQSAAYVPRLLLVVRKLADGEVGLLLTGTRSAEGYTQDLHLCATGARTLRVDAHMARSRLRRPGQGNLQSASF